MNDSHRYCVKQKEARQKKRVHCMIPFIGSSNIGRTNL